MEVLVSSNWGRWKTAFAFAAAAGLLVAIYWIRSLLLLTFLAILLGILLDAMAWVGMRFLKMSRGVAVISAAVVFVIALGAAVALMVVPLLRQGTDLVKSLPQTVAKLDRQVEKYRRDLPWLERIWPAATTPKPSATAAEVPKIAKKALITVSAALEGGATALAVFFLGLFLAWDPERWLRGMAELWPGPGVAERIDLFQKLGDGLRQYLLMLALTIVVMAAAWTLGLWLIGIKYSLLFGVIAGLVEVVPYVGPMLGLVPPLLMSLTGGMGKVLYVLLLYAILHVLEGYVLVPYVMQRGTHLPPPVVVLSILIFGALFGTLGVILAVPLGTVIYIWVNERVYARRRSDSTIIAKPARAA